MWRYTHQCSCIFSLQAVTNKQALSKPRLPLPVVVRGQCVAKIDLPRLSSLSEHHHSYEGSAQWRLPGTCYCIILCIFSLCQMYFHL